MSKIGGSGWLSSEQKGDNFHFLCGGCGKAINFVNLGVAIGVGFSLSAKCKNCGNQYDALKINGFADEGLKPHIQACYKKVEVLRNGSAQGE